MKAKILVLALALATLGIPCFAGAVHLTGNLSADFIEVPSAQDIVATFEVGGQPLFWGVGWEVVLDRMGFGGDYAVSFLHGTADASTWWLDWYSPALYMSYHIFGSTAFIDPFIQVGVGCAGRVLLSSSASAAADSLDIALLPFVAAGLSLDLDGLLISAKASYTPYASQIPVTDIPAYPLGKVQVTLSAGLSLGW